MADTYRRGIQALKRERARSGDLGPIAMPGAQAERMRQIGRQAAQLDAAIRAFSPPTDKLGAFVPWREEWARTYADWQRFAADTGSWDRLWGSTANAIEDWARGIDAWSKDFATKWGGQVIGPAPTLREPPQGLQVPWWLVLVAGGAVAAYVLWGRSND